MSVRCYANFFCVSLDTEILLSVRLRWQEIRLMAVCTVSHGKPAAADWLGGTLVAGEVRLVARQLGESARPLFVRDLCWGMSGADATGGLCIGPDLLRATAVLGRVVSCIFLHCSVGQQIPEPVGMAGLSVLSYCPAFLASCGVGCACSEGPMHAWFRYYRAQVGRCTNTQACRTRYERRHLEVIRKPG